jgi:hypothetical protein
LTSQLAAGLAGAGVGAAASLAGVLFTSVTTRRRDAYNSTVVLCARIAGLDQLIWSGTSAGPELLSQLRVIDVQLALADVTGALRLYLAATSYSCWRAIEHSGDAREVPHPLLLLHRRVQVVATDELLRRGSGRHRRRQRKRVLEAARETEGLTLPPGMIVDLEAELEVEVAQELPDSGTE